MADTPGGIIWMDDEEEEGGEGDAASKSAPASASSAAPSPERGGGQGQQQQQQQPSGEDARVEALQRELAAVRKELAAKVCVRAAAAR
jgi:hypothetical protein